MVCHVVGIIVAFNFTIAQEEAIKVIDCDIKYSTVHKMESQIRGVEIEFFPQLPYDKRFKRYIFRHTKQSGPANKTPV